MSNELDGLNQLSQSLTTVRYLRKEETFISLFWANVIEKNEYVLFMKNDIRVIDGMTFEAKRRIGINFNCIEGFCIDFGGFSKLLMIDDELNWCLVEKRPKHFETCLVGSFSRQNQSTSETDSMHWVLNRVSSDEVIILFSIFRGRFDVLRIKLDPFKKRFSFKYTILNHTYHMVMSMSRFDSNIFSVVYCSPENGVGSTCLQILEFEEIVEGKDISIKPGPFHISNFGEYFPEVIFSRNFGMYCVSPKHIINVNFNNLLHIKENVVLTFDNTILDLIRITKLSASLFLFLEYNGKSQIFDVETNSFSKSIDFCTDLNESKPPVFLKRLKRDLKNEIWTLYVSYQGRRDIILSFCSERIVSYKLFRQKIGEIKELVPNNENQNTYFLINERDEHTQELKSVELGIERKVIGKVFSPTSHIQIDDFYVVQTPKESLNENLNRSDRILLLIHNKRNSSSVMNKNRVTKSFPFVISKFEYIGSDFFLCLNSTDGTVVVMKKYLTRLEIVIPRLELSDDENNREERALNVCSFSRDHGNHPTRVAVTASPSSQLILFSFSRRAMRKEKSVVWKGNIESIEHMKFSSDGNCLILVTTNPSRKRRRMLILSVPAMKMISKFDEIGDLSVPGNLFLLPPHWIFISSGKKIVRLCLKKKDEKYSVERMEEWDFSQFFVKFYHLRSQNRIWVVGMKSNFECIIQPKNRLIWGTDSSYSLSNDGKSSNNVEKNQVMCIHSVDRTGSYLVLLEDIKTKKRGFQTFHFDEDKTLFFEDIRVFRNSIKEEEEELSNNDLRKPEPIGCPRRVSQLKDGETFVLFKKVLFSVTRNQVLFEPIREREEEFVDFVYFSSLQLFVIYSQLIKNHDDGDDDDDDKNGKVSASDELHFLYFLKYEREDGILEFYDCVMLEDILEIPASKISRKLAKMEVIEAMDFIILLFEENGEILVIEIPSIREKKIVYNTRSYRQPTEINFGENKKSVSISVLKDTCFIMVCPTKENNSSKDVIVYTIKKDQDLRTFATFAAEEGFLEFKGGVDTSYISKEGDLIIFSTEGVILHIPLLLPVSNPNNIIIGRKGKSVARYNLGGGMFNGIIPFSKTEDHVERFITWNCDGAIVKLGIVKDFKMVEILRYIFRWIVQSPVLVQNDFLLDNRMLRNIKKMGEEGGMNSEILRLFLGLGKNQQLRILGEISDVELKDVIDVLQYL